MEVSKHNKALEHTSKAIALIHLFMTINNQTKLQFKDHIKNVILSSSKSSTPQQQALQGVSQTAARPRASA